MRRPRHPVLALLALLALAACSRGDAVSPLELEVVKAARAAIAAGPASKTPTPALTRAVLDTIDGALLEVTLERRNQRAYLYVNAQRRDGGPGKVVTWRTGDDITLAMRNGVLIATRGLGGDILSATVQVAGDRPGPARGGEKSFDIRALDHKARRLTLTCTLSDLGPATIEIIDRTYATRHIRETCEGGVAGYSIGYSIGAGTGAPGRVVNDYWVDAGAGLVWQSRQWAGPQTGYLRMRRVIR